MTIKEAKAIDMVSYLSAIGYEPVKITGVNYWYLSPFRNEKTPSFKINKAFNRWYDFGEGKGGNLLDFILAKDDITISDALEKLARFILPSASPNIKTPPLSTIEILNTFSVSSFALVRYYQFRRIPATIAETYLKEVRYRNGNKIFYALGFQNDAGGYELRAPKFKGSCSPKSPSLIQKDATSLAVFEGFFDFLSYLTIYQHQPAPHRDFLILNSTSFFEQQLSIMQVYSSVHLYLDNDTTGSKYTEMALAIDNKKFIDERPLYQPYKDLNDWIMYIGQGPYPAV